MKVYLMRHGIPVPKVIDPDKPLSDQGRDAINKVAEFLEKAGIKVEAVFHSGKARARQTAEIMISKLKPGEKPVKKDNLSPLDDVKVIAKEIKDSEKDLMIVGHLPHLANLASLLITGNESKHVVAFQQGCLLCLTRENEGDWSISWMLVPEII